MIKFIYDGVVTDENFCPRKEEIKTLNSYIKDSTNVLLIAKRRMGKTSLVHEVFKNHLDSKKYISIYVDIFDITDEYDFANSLYRATAKSLKLDLKKLLNILKDTFKKASFDITIGEDGSPSFSPKLVTQNCDDILADVFNGIYQYLKNNNLKGVFCIDEFQQICSIKRPLDATIRKYIQHHDNICYIFTGSKRSTLTQLFQGQKSPLMGMVTPMELGPINQNDFFNFANKRLPKLNLMDFKQIYSMAEGESKLIQHFLRIIANENGTNDIDIETTVDKFIREVDPLCRSLIENMSPNSKKVLKMIIHQNGSTSLLSKELLNKFNLSKSSVQSAINFLLKEDIIFIDNDKYYIDGGLGSTFALWCNKKLE